MTAPALAASPAETSTTRDICHNYCCDMDTAWCGADITDHAFCTGCDNPCPTCAVVGELDGIIKHDSFICVCP